MRFNYSLDDIRCFCTVAQYGSFKQAAIALDMPLSTLSRRVAKLENDLTLRLLNRDSHHVQLTTAGQRYYERSAHLFHELDDIALSLQQDKIQAKGIIRVATPVNFGVDVLAQHFTDFLKEYPEIHLDLRLSNHAIDLEEDSIDIAFRIGDHNSNHWIGRHLTNIRFIICSSVNLDLPQITEPSDLENLPTVLCSPMSTWQLQHKITGENFSHNLSNTRLKVDDINLLTRTIQQGIGIGFMPDYQGQPLIDSGEFKQILPQWSDQSRNCQILYRDRDNIPLRVRLMIDFMLKRFSDN